MTSSGGEWTRAVRRDPRAKLTPSQRDEIRQRYQDGEATAALALEYRVTTETIKRMGGPR